MKLKDLNKHLLQMGYDGDVDIQVLTSTEEWTHARDGDSYIIEEFIWDSEFKLSLRDGVVRLGEKQ